MVHNENPDNLFLVAEAYREMLREHQSPETRYMSGRSLCEEAFNALKLGLKSIAVDTFQVALPDLLKDLSVRALNETKRVFTAESREETLADIPEKYHDRVTIVGEINAPGQGAMSRNSQWTCVALCRWMLDSQHDAASLNAASDELAKCFALEPKDEQYDSMAMDDQGMTYIAAGDDQRFLDLCSRARKFKPPAKPGMVRTPRSMAYVLAAHRLKQFWSADEVERAWSTFLKTYVPKAMSGGAITDLALWLKMRFWDHGESAPTLSPEEAFMRLYDYLPGVERPPLQD